MSRKNKKLCSKPNNAFKSTKSLYDICNWNFLDNIAIEYHGLVGETITITYAQLNSMVMKICDTLSACESFECIGISYDVMNHYIPPLILGIISANHAFINLPGPVDDCRNLLTCLNMKYLFASDLLPKTFIFARVEMYGADVLLLKLQETDQKKSSSDSMRYIYAITTSGSTDVPKIVKVPHSCILPNILDFKRILNLTECDKVLQLTTFTFDPSIVEVFLAFSCGGTLVMVTKDLKHDANRLLQTVYATGVTVLQSAPSVFLSRWSPECLKSTIFNTDSGLRILLLGGDPFPNINALMKVVNSINKTRIFNVYGITEVSCWASINEIVSNGSNADAAYLGETLSETLFQIKNEEGQVLQEGEGTLYIGSTSRICIVNNETFSDLKQPVFRDTGDIVTMDKNGRIFYKGRRNRVVKRLGNKLNLRKLDESLQELHFVENSYALWDEECHKLHLFVTTIKPATKVEEIKRNIIIHLKRLPAFYKPDSIEILECFELTNNGKICTRFLQKYSQQNDSRIKRDSVESTFKDVWMNYVRFHENYGFVKLGGTSVDAMQISLTLSTTLKIEFPELIGLLLRDATFNECLDYINYRVGHNDFKTQSSNRLGTFSEYQTFKVDEVANINTNNQNTKNFTPGENTCLWQKCRGKVSGTLENVSQKSVVSKIETIPVFNLQKCVDASPTLFQYSNDNLFVTVGSHAGIICTLEIQSTGIKSNEMKLPDRIEAAILVLNNFQGIVGCYDGYVYSLNLRTGKRQWQFRTEGIVKCTAITCEQGIFIFVGSYDCHVYCLSAKDGEEIWKVKASEGSVSATGCLHLPTNSVLFGTLDGTCIALDQRQGNVLWRKKLKSPIFTAPIVSQDGSVIFSTVDGIIHCFNIEANDEIWTYSISGNIFSYPIILQEANTKRESLIIASTNKNLYCLRFDNGAKEGSPELKYVLSFESAIYATPWYENDILFVACTDGTCKAIRHSKAEVLTTIKLPGECFSSPVFVNDTVFLGCRNNNLYALKIL